MELRNDTEIICTSNDFVNGKFTIGANYRISKPFIWADISLIKDLKNYPANFCTIQDDNGDYVLFAKSAVYSNFRIKNRLFLVKTTSNYH